MPTTKTHRPDGGIDARIVAGDTHRLTIPTASDGPFMVGLRNLSTNATATVAVTTSLADEADPVIEPLFGEEGYLLPFASQMVVVQARVAALIVVVPADADGDVLVNVLT